MKHPLIVGSAVGALGVLAWWKRYTIRSWFSHIRSPFHGAAPPTVNDPNDVVQRVLQSRKPTIVVIASGYDGPRIRELVAALRRGAPRETTIIDAEGWPSAARSN
jgi:hypothetical protein